MKLPLVSIIIVNLNGINYLENCLNSIKKNTSYLNYNIIVVDNGSTDGTQKLVKSKYPQVDLIENKENRGLSGGNNDGIKYAINKYNPDYFLLLNNDTTVEKNWLNEAVKTAQKSENTGIVGLKQLTFERKPAISAGWIKLFRVKYYFGNEEEKVGWVSGAGFVIKKEVIQKIGLLDEMYNPCYYEESDWEKRAMLNGFKIVYCPKSVFLHKGGGDTGQEKSINFNLVFYINRSRFFSKYYPLGFIIRFFTDIYRSRKKIKFKEMVISYWKGFYFRNNVKIEYPYDSSR